jgi:hypothetical protein
MAMKQTIHRRIETCQAVNFQGNRKPANQTEKLSSMKKISVLLALFAAGWSAACAAPTSTNSAAANRILMIDSSSMPIGGGSATLTIGALQRVNGVYIGDYKLKVFPYFLKERQRPAGHPRVGCIAGQGQPRQSRGDHRHRHHQRQRWPVPAHRGHCHAGGHQPRKAQAVVHGRQPANDVHANVSL